MLFAHAPALLPCPGVHRDKTRRAPRCIQHGEPSSLLQPPFPQPRQSFSCCVAFGFNDPNLVPTASFAAVAVHIYNIVHRVRRASPSIAFPTPTRLQWRIKYTVKGYYQPAGPLIHAGSELCRAATSKLSGSSSSGPAPSQPSSLLLPSQQEPHSEQHPNDPGPSTSSPLPPPPPPTSSHIVSSQGSPFRHYTPYATYAPQYHPPPPHQYYHTSQSALVASHHLPPPSQDLCGYSPCYPPHYKYPTYRRFAPPPPHFYPPPPPTHQPDVYSLPSSSAASSFQPPPASSSSAPSGQQQHQAEAGTSSAPPQPGSAYPPPPPSLSQQPPEPPPAYQFYPGYNASYQSCPCPMQSCPKNVHTGPLTGDSKGPGPQESLFVMPPVAAAAAAAHPTSASRGPLPPGHPPSPARGSSGGPPQAQGPSPPTTADQNLQQSPEAPAWVAAEPTPPPSDDSSAPRGGDTDLCDSESCSTDVNQNYSSTKKRRLSISSHLDCGTKKMKSVEFPPLDTSTVFSAINEPLLITTTMLQQSSKKQQDTAVILRGDVENNNNILPPTPPTSADITPPAPVPKPKVEKKKKAKTPKTPLTTTTPPKRKQQQPRKRNTSMLKSHGMRDSPPELTSPTDSEESAAVPVVTPDPCTSEAPKVKGKGKSKQKNVVSSEPPPPCSPPHTVFSDPSTSSSSSATEVMPAVSKCKPIVTATLNVTPVEVKGKGRKSTKLVPSATDATSLPGNEESAGDFVFPAKPAAKKGGKRKCSPSLSITGKRSKKMSTAAALAAAREAEETAQNDLLKKTSLRKAVLPKWSNGWSWEGEPFQAKVFLRVSEMMLSLLWYYRPEHTEKGRKDEDMPDEIFASKHKDSSSVACIEDKCYVLTFNEYCRYRANVRQIEEGAPPRPLVVPPLPPDPSTSWMRERMPSTRVSPDLVFFCRKVYDFRQKRMLKNPG
ncbi:hypothetical protein B566_EDAN001881 [Ephemera danica]|nr:hypothetical protein B566_EDAN001881 [Ephemera danica]